jgi:hypothetical protein
MSTVLVAAILVGTVIAICLLFITITNKQKARKLNQLLNRFSELGTSHNLAFSSQEVLNNRIIGLDGINRKLLVLTQNDNQSFDDSVVNLDEVKNCTVSKIYSHINYGNVRNVNLEKYLERIVLHFEFTDIKDTVEIVFYSHIDNTIYQIEEMEQKAVYWKQILTKMLKDSIKKQPVQARPNS